MRACATVRAVHACATYATDLAVLSTLPGNLGMAKMGSYLSVSSLFSLSVPWIITDETAADSVEMYLDDFVCLSDERCVLARLEAGIQGSRT